MPSRRHLAALAVPLAALALPIEARATSLRGRNGGLSLAEVRSVLPNADSALDRLAATSVAEETADEENTQACRHCRGPVRASVRRRNETDASSAPNSQVAQDVSQEQAWDALVAHAWRIAATLTRTADDAPLSLLGEIDALKAGAYHHPSPFLLCSRSTTRDILSIFEPDDMSLLHMPDEDKNCVVLTTTTEWVRANMRHDGDLAGQPLVDVAKMARGTVESVSSEAWRIPFASTGNERTPSRQSRNATDLAFDGWERTLTVDLTPGLGLQSEDDALDLASAVLQDIRRMAEAGRGQRRADGGNQDENEQYKNEALEGVPSLREMFSPTAASSRTPPDQAQAPHDRASFWDQALANGLESSHGCASLFDTLAIVPILHGSGTYESFDLVLNPSDGPPPNEYASSASNVDCVSSLLAGLSVHPAVREVAANVPAWRGWSSVARALGLLSR